MKIGWVSVSPWAITGYGGVTRTICSRILERHEIVCMAHEADVIVWGAKKEMPVGDGRKLTSLVMPNPLVSPESALDVIRLYIKRYSLEILIGHWDAFALEILGRVGAPYLTYIPIDGPMTGKWANYVRNAYLNVTYSKFGYRELLRFLPPSRVRYIPHMIDCSLFRPIDEDKAALRREVEADPPIPEDCYLAVSVGANIGARKLIPLMLKTFKRFSDRHPDAHLYMQTNAVMPYGRGYDLPIWVDMLGLKEKVHFPTYNPILEPLLDEKLARLYNAADVYLTNSMAEGFGLPVAEAQACGVPAIAPRNSSHVELVEGHGWLVENLPEDMYEEIPAFVPQLPNYPIPNQRSLLACMEEAYSRGDLRRRYSDECREFMLQYDPKRVMPLWWRLLEEVEFDLVLLSSVQKHLST